MKLYVPKNSFIRQEVNFGSRELRVAGDGNWRGRNPVFFFDISILNNAALKLHVVRFAITTNGQF